MTNLSPAAQAVWNAFNDVSERVGVFEDYGDALAAALRAAADQLREAYANEVYVDSADDWLDDIADELEGVKYGTYRCNLEDK
jgi:cytochrome c556